MKRAFNKVNLGDSHICEHLKNPDSDNKRIRLERRLRRQDTRNDSLQHNRVAIATKTTTKICGYTSVSIDGDSHICEHLKSPDSDNKITRLERRWRRREARIDSLKNNHVASSTKTTTKICGNTSVSIDKNDHMIDEEIDDEIDEDWAKYLATYTGDDDDEVDSDYEAYLATYTGDDDIEADSTSNQSRDNEVDLDYGAYLAISNLDIGADRASNQSRDSDEVDPDYRTYLATLNPEIGADSASNQSGDSDEVDPDYGTYLATYNPEIEVDSATSNQSGGSDEVDPDYASYLATLNPDFEIDCASSHSDGSNIDADFGNDSVGEEIDEDDHLLRKRSSVRRTSLVSDQAFDTPQVQDNIDEDYEAFLNAVTIVDDEEEYFRVKNPRNTSNVEDRSNSSDSDLIVMDSIPICENTPFISSKAYDKSCFGEEANPGNMHDKMQISACYDSQFRRRLMECLDKPYDQEEYDHLMLYISKRHLKERHVETRQGVVKSYHSKGVSKSFLDWYPDLEKAIAEFKEAHRVLFLLRGFSVWNEHVEHPGRFQPWLDKQCLEKLRKM